MLAKIRRILSYFYPDRRRVLFCMICALLVNGAEIAGPYLIKVAIDDYIIAAAPANLGRIAWIYLSIVSIGAAANYIQTCQLNLVVQKMIHRIRMELFSHIQHLSLTFFDRNASGRIMTRAANDVEALNDMYSGVLVACFKDLFLLAGIIGVMLRLDLRLALLSLTAIPILITVTFAYRQKARSNFKIVRSLIARINGFLAENLSGMKLVQVFNRQRQKYQEFKALNDEYNRASLAEVMLLAVFKPSAEMINALIITLLIWTSIPGIFNGSVEIGLLFAFITYIKKFFEPINDLADKYNVILAGGVAAERIFELKDSCKNLENLGQGQPLKDIKGAIEFDHVWFAYSDQDWVLKDVSFKVEPGQTVAFVGETGAGKSTIIQLISRFYEIQRGTILVDGLDIRELRLEDLRRRIAVIMQDVFLFTGDIASNIRLKNTAISDARIKAAATAVDADGFIEALPDQYHQAVNERGSILSAGQRQLIAFARAIAFDPAILVLDEATANIDTETEQLIQNALEKISLQRTTLIIAHRLSTIRNADQIIVMAHGTIAQQGNHQTLLGQEGIYRQLYQKQFAVNE